MHCFSFFGNSSHTPKWWPCSTQRFGIPIPILNTSACSVTINSALEKLISLTEPILWDEALMAHKYNILTVNRTIKNVTEVLNKMNTNECMKHFSMMRFFRKYKFHKKMYYQHTFISPKNFLIFFLNYMIKRNEQYSK